MEFNDFEILLIDGKNEKPNIICGKGRGWRPITPYMGVIGYHVTLSEGHMIANHPL